MAKDGRMVVTIRNISLKIRNTTPRISFMAKKFILLFGISCAVSIKVMIVGSIAIIWDPGAT